MQSEQYCAVLLLTDHLQCTRDLKRINAMSCCEAEWWLLIAKVIALWL